jgi:cellobiose-specific phosphotransferase system component IIC
VVSYVVVGGSGGFLPLKIFCIFLTPRTEM